MGPTKNFGRLIFRPARRSLRSLNSCSEDTNSRYLSRRFLHAPCTSSPKSLSDFGSLKISRFQSSNPYLWSHLGGQRRSMFIQTQSTPNPASLMFYPGKPVMEAGSADFPNARTAMSSPLAKSIFGIEAHKGIGCYWHVEHTDRERGKC